MRWTQVVPLATLGSALVVPNEQVFAQLPIESNSRNDQSWSERILDLAYDTTTRISDLTELVAQDASAAWSEIRGNTAQAFDHAIEHARDFGEDVQDTVYDVESWEEANLENLFDFYDYLTYAEDEPHPPPGPPPGGPPPPHGPPPKDGPPHHGPGHEKPPHHEPGHEKPPHHGPPDHKRPHHPPPHHDHKPNQTVYQLINESKYTTKLAKLINKYDDLVDALNSTKANVTLFAPIDAAFEKIPKHHPEPSKEQLKALLSYHVVPGLYPAKRVLFSHTAPTLLKGEHLSDQPEPQRIAFKLGLNGLTVNFYSRVVGVNFFATNGVVHGIASLLVPPPNAITIVDLLPSEFSTLELGLVKTGLLDKLNTTDHNGGTLFAPSNFAFRKLGPRANAFLFSSYGTKYLKALLEYHVVHDFTLYSDAFYKAGEKKDSAAASHDFSIREEIPGGKFHVDLPTLLKDRSLSVDLVRFGGIASIHINGYTRVTVSDGIAEDGVIHGVSDVLIPPKQLGGGVFEKPRLEAEELSVEELKERLEPFIDAKADL